ncbi:MAG: alanine racemase, partial [Flavobacteriales bacterium]
IELETGMNRLGFTKKQLSGSLNFLKNNKKYYQLMGVCTHFAGAEHVANYVRVKEQFRKYREILTWLRKRGIRPKYRHVASSAASISFPKSMMDMVRVGILQYGFWPSIEIFINYLSENKTTEDPIDRVISWKSKVMNTRDVKPGEFIGYGTSYLAKQNMKVAGIPIGYADGYSRALSNQGRVLVNDARVSVVGTVNMNMVLADITDVPHAKKGDEVVLIGDQGEHTITVASFGDMSSLLNYELLTKLSTSIPRIVIN